MPTLIFDKGGKNRHLKNMVLSTNCAVKTRSSSRIKLNSYFPLCTKIHSKWTKYLIENQTHEKETQKKQGLYTQQDIGTGKSLLNRKIPTKQDKIYNSNIVNRCLYLEFFKNTEIKLQENKTANEQMANILNRHLSRLEHKLPTNMEKVFRIPKMLSRE